jgi:arginase
MTRILVPYHLDEHLAGLDPALEPDVTVTADLPDGDKWCRMAHLYQKVAAVVAEEARLGKRPVIISGDCTTSLGTVAGLQRAGIEPAIVWLDAHGDVQTLETSTSGYLGGMPLRILAGYRPELIAQPLGLRGIPEERMLLVGARDLDPPERSYLQQASIRRCRVEDLRSGDLPDGPFYLHLDVDVIDSGEIPGLLFPVADGPSISRLAEALGDVFGTGRVAAFGLACTWRPGAGAGERLRPHLESAMAAAKGRVTHPR